MAAWMRPPLAEVEERGLFKANGVNQNRPDNAQCAWKTGEKSEPEEIVSS